MAAMYTNDIETILKELKRIFNDKKLSPIEKFERIWKEIEPFAKSIGLNTDSADDGTGASPLSDSRINTSLPISIGPPSNDDQCTPSAESIPYQVMRLSTHIDTPPPSPLSIVRLPISSRKIRTVKNKKANQCTPSTSNIQYTPAMPPNTPVDMPSPSPATIGSLCTPKNKRTMKNRTADQCTPSTSSTSAMLPNTPVDMPSPSPATIGSLCTPKNKRTMKNKTTDQCTPSTSSTSAMLPSTHVDIDSPRPSTPSKSKHMKHKKTDTEKCKHLNVYNGWCSQCGVYTPAHKKCKCCGGTDFDTTTSCPNNTCVY